MEASYFDGQQEGEKILYEIEPHPLAKYVAIAKVVFLAVFFYLILLFIASVAVLIAPLLQIGGLILCLLLLAGGIWWNLLTHGKSRSFVTDRRVVRFEVVTPFLTTKRALFWNEALKAKGHAPNLLYKYLRIGTVTVEPHMAEHGDVRITDVFYYEDLVNYIDKILFTFKNAQNEIANIRPFVPKPRGQRH